MFEDAGDESRQVITDAWKEGVSQLFPSIPFLNREKTNVFFVYKYNLKSKRYEVFYDKRTLPFDNSGL